MFRKFRILLLLFVLATVGLGAWRANARLTAWQHTIPVALYPVAADDSPVTAAFLRRLEADAFAGLARWVQAESERHGRPVLQPIALALAPVLSGRPPLPPDRPGVLDAVAWSLQLRWWASQHDAIAGPRPQVRLFLLFHDPARTPSLPHSTGLSKGGIGLIHVFASPGQQAQNLVVVAHELLHVFGATDKYDPATLQPLFPAGYAEPERGLPQRRAEIMGGRIPVDAQRAEIPDRLEETLIGPQTAREIGLLR
ncbi:hypothetical protein [Azonexus sp.]|uniref:hypothetical protein n=1 Tax=Azonexus sp. TaxID=1872668 RepID=UPI0035B45BF5